MRTNPVSDSDLRGVFPVPPLSRKSDAKRSLDLDQNTRLLRHMTDGGMTRFLYGGNAFLYHLTLVEYEELLGWLNGFAENLWAIPSAGPSYGRAMDQAPLLRKYSFPAVMMLPCGDPRDAAGLERGMREFSDAAATPLVVYLKDESNFGANQEAGLDAVARLVSSGVCVAIKYAVVRPDPNQDKYLEGLLKRVDRAKVISGMGERPAIVHMRDWNLPGFTTGSGCVAPKMSNGIFHACVGKDYAHAEELRATFMPLEDLRDAWGPARVLHQATELAGIASTGPLIPYVSALSETQAKELGPVAKALVERDRKAAARTAAD